MEYKKALDYINSDDKRGHTGSLDNISRLLDALGNPHNKLKFVHVTGTNGKGSTSNFIAAILKESGYNVGLFTSPHILQINERIKLNQQEITNNDFGKYMEIVKEAIDKLDFIPTYFEILVALGLVYFADKNADIVVLEVGIGGAKDPTNIVKNTMVSVITPIGLDHKDRLGNTVEEVAFEKSGIIKENSKVISYNNVESVNKIFSDKAMEKNSPITFFDPSNVDIIYSDLSGSRFKYEDITYDLNMLGEHQIYNAVMAIITVKALGFESDQKAVYNALKNATWLGRMTVVSKNPTFIIDGAHNEHGFAALLKNLKSLNKPSIILGLGIMKDKEIGINLEQLTKLAKIVLFIKSEYERAMPEEELSDLFSDIKFKTFSNISESIDYALEISDKDDVIIFTGSLYVAGELISIFKNK